MAPQTTIDLAVVGAHLAGQPLHHELTDRGAVFLTETATAPCYRLYALATAPPKPGLVRRGGDDPGGRAIAVEVYRLGAAGFGTFVAAVPPPLAIGTVQLSDGSAVAGFVCEPIALEDATEITHHGGWRAYLAAAAEGG